jgi:hypothetical protein
LVCTDQWHAGFPLLDAAVKAHPRFVAALAERGMAYGISEGYASGLLDLKIAMDLDPTFYRAWAYRAALHVKRGMWGDVIADAEHAIAIAPQYPPPHRLLGIGWQGYGKGDRAIDAFQDYLARLPNAPDRAQIETAIDHIQHPPPPLPLSERLRRLIRR